MSVSPVATRKPSYQPFQCLICHSRFTRHENLKRHSALHNRSQNEASLPCDFCHATFSRPDLRNRHMKRKHPEEEQSRSRKTQSDVQARSRASQKGSPRENSASLSPADSQNDLLSHQPERAHFGLDDGTWNTAGQHEQQSSDFGPDRGATASLRQPYLSDSTCINQIVQEATDLEQNLLMGAPFFKPTHSFGLQLQQADPAHSIGPNLTGLETTHSSPDRLSTNELLEAQREWFPSTIQIERGCDLFFRNVSPYVPFLHQPTFDPSQTPPFLILSMLSLAFQHGEDPDCGDQIGSGANLSINCFHRARFLALSSDNRPDVPSEDIAMVQSYLLLQICAMMFLCGKDSAHGLKMHSSMISLARTCGLMQPIPVEPSTATDLDSLWREFARSESHKRTSFAVHQVDALWYQFLSIPRSISHLEIKHDLPCPRDQWKASSAAEWAHKQLISRNTGPSVQYADSVRQFLSADPDLQDIPPFDPYGAVNIAQFLISSAREISGWSTMTGMLSMERFGALRSSLLALGPFIRPEPHAEDFINLALCEATWETAMIEIQLWSPSHTGGIVEGSIDAVLSQSTFLAPSAEFLCEPETAKSVQPHVDWFLRYLDTVVVPGSEAPWVALYAYKAFLIAWQLLRGGIPGAMEIVGVADGDENGALEWARKIFMRRQRWQLGRLILACLDALEK